MELFSLVLKLLRGRDLKKKITELNFRKCHRLIRPDKPTSAAKNTDLSSFIRLNWRDKKKKKRLKEESGRASSPTD